MRMSYGRSGSRLGRVLVSAPFRESAPNPRWLRVVEVFFWILVPVLVIRFAVPPTPRQMTVIDTSRLMEKPLPELEKPIVPEIQQLPKVKPPVVSVAKQDRSQVEIAPKPLEHGSVPLQEKSPTLVRPSGNRVASASEFQPRIARERVSLQTETGTPSATRIRRETVVSDSPSGGVTIARTRGAVTVDVPVAAGYRVAPLRGTPVAGDVASGGGAGTGMVLRSTKHSGRSYGYGSTTEGSGPIVIASRGRASATGTGGGQGSSAVGLVRGVSLMSLDICPSPQEEEDHIRAVLGVVGSRQSCTNDKGEFQFRGTKRISSFNLMIYPANGRRPSNRCEELEYAYRCLTTH
jgi:hypothetical protein